MPVDRRPRAGLAPFKMEGTEMNRTSIRVTAGPVLAILAAALSAAAACAPDRTGRAAEPAVPAPAFSLTDLRGNTVSLDGYKGKVLFVNFWATWCPPCRREIPDFIEAYRELKGEGLEILGLSLDELTEAEVAEWVKSAGINYPVAMATPEIVGAYEPGQFIPATIVVDGRGRIRHRESGLMTKAALVRLFRDYQ